MHITICGGGNLGHVVYGYLSSQAGNSVSLLTSRPALWSPNLEVRDSQGRVFRASLRRVSAEAADVIPNADLVLLCLPGYAIHPVLASIAPYLKPKTWVGSVVSSTGFFFEAKTALPCGQPLFGFQRVPFISRVIEYGCSAELKGYKESLSVAVEGSVDKETVRATLEQLFHTQVKMLGSFYEASLSNSNPLLHTSRLYTLWRDWRPGIYYPANPMFYSEWTVEASTLYIAMDWELQQLAIALGLKRGSIPTVLDYYESTDAESLTAKLRLIEGFRGIASPMIQTEQGWQPDFTSRYFTEDFPYGLKYPWQLAKEHHIPVPNIDQVYEWGISHL